MRFLIGWLLIFGFMSAEAAPQCSFVFSETIKEESSKENLDSISQKMDQFIFSGSPENLQDVFKNSPWFLQKYKTWRLKRLLNQIHDLDSMSEFDVSVFAYKLDQLVLMQAAESSPEFLKKLSSSEKIILSAARRSLIENGLIDFMKVFKDENTSSVFWQKLNKAFSVAFDYQYWRWMNPFYMSKLVGASLPPELAQKIALDGLNAHRAEAEKYLPLLKTKNYFNQFSKIYNYTILISLFTVFPYMTNYYYEQKVAQGAQSAVAALNPLKLRSEELLTSIRSHHTLMEVQIQNYQELYKAKYGHLPTDEQMQKVREYFIHSQKK